jgi:hypothetical protein
VEIGRNLWVAALRCKEQSLSRGRRCTADPALVFNLHRGS